MSRFWYATCTRSAKYTCDMTSVFTFVAWCHTSVDKNTCAQQGHARQAGQASQTGQAGQGTQAGQANQASQTGQAGKHAGQPSRPGRPGRLGRPDTKNLCAASLALRDAKGDYAQVTVFDGNFVPFWQDQCFHLCDLVLCQAQPKNLCTASLALRRHQRGLCTGHSV